MDVATEAIVEDADPAVAVEVLKILTKITIKTTKMLNKAKTTLPAPTPSPTRRALGTLTGPQTRPVLAIGVKAVERPTAQIP